MPGPSPLMKPPCLSDQALAQTPLFDTAGQDGGGYLIEFPEFPAVGQAPGLGGGGCFKRSGALALVCLSQGLVVWCRPVSAKLDVCFDLFRHLYPLSALRCLV